jgi:hypothetical protein
LEKNDLKNKMGEKLLKWIDGHVQKWWWDAKPFHHILGYNSLKNKVEALNDHRAL